MSNELDNAKKTLTITITGAWAQFVDTAAQMVNTSAANVTERLIAGAMARRSALQEAFPGEPEKAVIFELLMRDGALWPEKAEQVFAGMRAATLEQIKAVLMPDSAVIAMGGEGNA